MNDSSFSSVRLCAAPRVSIHRMHGPVGVPSAATGMVLMYWLVTATATIGGAGRTAASVSCVAATTADHISPGSCSAPPPSGRNVVCTGRLRHASVCPAAFDQRHLRPARAEIDGQHAVGHRAPHCQVLHLVHDSERSRRSTRWSRGCRQWAGAHVELAPLHGGITNTNYVATVRRPSVRGARARRTHRTAGHRPGQRGRGRHAGRRAGHRPAGRRRAARDRHAHHRARARPPPRAGTRSSAASPTWSACCARFHAAARSPARSPSIAWSSGTRATPPRYGVIAAAVVRPAAPAEPAHRGRVRERTACHSCRATTTCCPATCCSTTTGDGVWLLDFEYAGHERPVLRPRQPQRELRPRQRRRRGAAAPLLRRRHRRRAGRGCS